MGEVPLYGTIAPDSAGGDVDDREGFPAAPDPHCLEPRLPHHLSVWGVWGLCVRLFALIYMGISLITPPRPVGPYRSPLPRDLW